MAAPGPGTELRPQRLRVRRAVGESGEGGAGGEASAVTPRSVPLILAVCRAVEGPVAAGLEEYPAGGAAPAPTAAPTAPTSPTVLEGCAGLQVGEYPDKQKTITSNFTCH